MIIDTHAHAFPSIKYHTNQLPPWAGSLATLGHGLARRVVRRADRTPRLSVERVAELRKRGPAALWGVLEPMLGLALLPTVALRGGLDDLIDSMDTTGIDRTVVIASWPAVPNEWLFDVAPLYGDRIIPIAHPPPLSEDTPIETWHEHYEQLVERGARGFKIHYNMQGRPIDSVAYRAMFDVAAKHDRIVIAHTGCFSVIGYKHTKPAAPELFVPYLEQYPDVRVCLAHMNRDHPEDAWDIMRKFDQVYADTSWQTSDSVREAIATVGTERILLGSDWPLLHGNLQADSFDVLKRACSDDQLEAICGDSARRFFAEA